MKIRGHKKINNSIITFGNENVLNTYYALVGLYNRQMEYNHLFITKQDLWNMTGHKGKYDYKRVEELVGRLTESRTFDLSKSNVIIDGLKIKKIGGSMFVITEYEQGKLKIEVPETFQQLLFYKKDLNLMAKAKKKQKMSLADLDYYDSKVKEKSKELVLFDGNMIFNLKGQYVKRMYTLLKQWEKVGEYSNSWEEFKNILEIPKSYRTNNIDERILNKAKIELRNANIEITSIEKTKKGRSIDRIIIKFKNLNKKVNSLKENNLKNLDREVEVIKDKTFETLRNKIREDEDMKKNVELRSKLNSCKTLEELELFVIENKIEINSI